MTDDTKPSTYTLTLAFDLDQISTALQFQISKNGLPALQTTGAAAGAYKMSKGDQVVVEIIATFDPQTTSADSISIQDLIVVSMPANGVHQTDLSPFVATSAGLFLQNWVEQDDDNAGGPLRPPPSSRGFVRFALNAPMTPDVVPASLLVTADKGQWQVSGYLSVLVKGLAGVAPFSRVYGFDPTVIVGTGGEDTFLAP